MMRFRVMSPSEVPWAALDRMPDRTVFQTRAWLEFLAETQSAQGIVAELRDGAAVVGYFTGAVFQRFGVRVLGSSFPGWTTPYIGFNLLPGVSHVDALLALERLAFGELKCLHLEVSDRQMKPEDGTKLGFEVEQYETYESDLRQSEAQILQSMDSACRRCIRKAEKGGVVIEEAADDGFASEYHEQLRDVFGKQGLVPTYSEQRVVALIRHLRPTGNLLLLRALSPDGKCIGTGIYPGFNKVAQFWGNASWRSTLSFRPNEALHWYALRYWRQRGVEVFDWGGLGGYKLKYGPKPVSHPWFVKSRFRVLAKLRERARALVDVRQRLLGRWHASRGPQVKPETEVAE
jgi:Acetyltransferase (GNAT) domain